MLKCSTYTLELQGNTNEDGDYARTSDSNSVHILVKDLLQTWLK